MAVRLRDTLRAHIQRQSAFCNHTDGLKFML